MNLFALFSLVAFVLSIQAAMYLFFFEKRVFAKNAFAVVFVSFSIYSFFHFLMQISDSYRYVEIYYRLYSIGLAVLPVFLTYFYLRLSKSASLLIISFIRYYMIPAYLFVIYVYLFVDLEKIAEISYTGSSWQVNRVYTQPFFYFSILNFVICTALSSIILYKWRKKSVSNREKRLSIRLLYIVLLTLPTMLIIHFIGPVLSIKLMPAYSPVPLMVAMGALFFYIKKYNQFNIGPEILSFLIIEQLKDFVIFVDYGRRIISANKFFFEKTQYTNAELQGTSSSVFFTESDVIESQLESTFDNKQLSSSYNEIIGKDQECHPVMVSCFINNDKYGNPIGYVLLCTDYSQTIELRKEITERVKKEKQLTVIKKELETLVDKKTVELLQANEKLKLEIYERKRAEEHVKAELDKKLTLVQEIHHRVKNNIQIIISLIKMVELQEDIDEGSSLKLHLLGNKVRSISEVHESFYALPHLAKINFGDYLKKTTGELYARKTGKQKVIFRMNVSDEFLDVDSAISCGIIFVEILTNALKHAFSDDVKKENIIGIEFFKAANSKFNLVISDNGVGVGGIVGYMNKGSIGLELVEVIAKKHLNANFEIKCHGGTIAVLEFAGAAYV